MTRLPLEKPTATLPAPGQVCADFGGLYAANAVVAFLFACTGPVAIVLSIGARGGLAQTDLASWLFGGFFLNGFISLAFALAYRQPLVFFWTIPGSVLVGPALAHASFPEVVGAFVATGLVMLVLGLSGWVRRATDAVPMPIVMAMVAGVFLRFGIDLVRAFRDELWVALPMTAGFVLLSALPRLARTVPPLIGALAIGAVAIWLLGAFQAPADSLFGVAQPRFHAPRFSWPVLVELVPPLVITVLAVQNAQGIAILRANGHDPPASAIAVACGAGAIVTAFVGAVSTCLTGPVNAVISSTGEKRRQYTSAILVALLGMAFGLLAPLFTRLMLAAPPAFVATLAGLAMLRVLQNAFVVSFQARYTLGALVCFVVTVADVPILDIGAAFWGLLLGLAASRLLERQPGTA